MQADLAELRHFSSTGNFIKLSRDYFPCVARQDGRFNINGETVMHNVKESGFVVRANSTLGVSRRLVWSSLIVVAVLILLDGVIPGFAQNGTTADGQKQHPQLIAERQRYEKEVEAAVKPAQRRYATRLKFVQKTMLKKGDKLGAAAVGAEMERLGAGAAQLKTYPIEGIWKVYYTNGATRSYQLTADGRVVFLGSKSRGRFTRSGNDVLVDFNDGKLERFHWRTTLIVEHYDPKSRYPNGQPSAVGFATKVR
jgi:hypothetical protein